MKNIPKPNEIDYALYYQALVDKVEAHINIIDQLKTNQLWLKNIVSTLTKDQLLFRYAADKWCIKDIIQHLIDVERIMVNRALHFVRGSKVPQAWFNENDYAREANASKKSIKQIMREYQTQRLATITFYMGLNKKDFSKIGIASNSSMSVSASIYIICGHEKHHFEIIEERYLSMFIN